MPTINPWRGALAATVACALSVAASARQDHRSPVHVTVVDAGTSREITTTAPTVGLLLHELELTLNPLDRSSHSPRTALTEGMKIVLTRVRVDTVTETTPIPFPSRSTYDPDLRSGVRAVLTPGKDGQRTATYRDTYRDGVRVKRVVLAQKQVAPRTEVVKVGLRGMSLASRGAFSRSRILTMRATGYGPGENGRWGNRTALGKRVGYGIVAVDPRIIPLGSRLYIEGYGHAIAGDTGSAIRGRRIDLGFDSDREAHRIGRREVRVMILR